MTNQTQTQSDASGEESSVTTPQDGVTYDVSFEIHSASESVEIDGGDIPDGLSVEEYVQEKLELWEIGVSPGRWSGDEYDHVTVVATDREDAQEAALNEHRHYSSVIDHSWSRIDSSPEPVAVEEVSA